MLNRLPASILQFITRNTFRKEIILVLLLKTIGLFLLWNLFFSHSIEKQLTPQKIASHLLNKN